MDLEHVFSDADNALFLVNSQLYALLQMLVQYWDHPQTHTQANDNLHRRME
jgi:hypothetical protein